MEGFGEDQLFLKCVEITLKQYKDDKSRVENIYKDLSNHEFKTYEGDRRKKNPSLSTELREKGNALFKRLNNCSYLSAWEYYTKSLAYAPKGSQELALAYGNRSAVLYRLKRYEACANDTRLTLEMDNYPKEKKPKIHLRRVQCLALIESEDIKQAFVDGFSWIQSTNLPDKEEKAKHLKETYLKRKNNNAVKLKIDTPDTTFDHFWEKYQKNPLSTNLLKVDVARDGKARVVARRDIRPGEVTTFMKPYVAVLDESALYNRCSECLKEIWSSIPCPECIYSVYCSEKCLETAWKEYHHVECQVLRFLGVDCGSTRVLLKLIIKAKKEAGGLQQLLKLIKETEESKCDIRKCIDNQSNIKNTFQALYCGAKISSHNPNASIALMASRVVFYLASETNFFGKKIDKKSLSSNKDVVQIGLSLLGIARANSMINPMKHLNTSLEQPLTYAWEINSLAVLYQHSCAPNTVVLSMKRTPIACAHRLIKKGDSVTVPFWDMLYWVINKKERKEQLKSKGIDCKCVACRQNWGLYANLPNLTELRPKPSVNIYKFKEIMDDYQTAVAIYADKNCKDKREALKHFSDMVTFFMESNLTAPTKELRTAEDAVTHIFLWACDSSEFS